MSIEIMRRVFKTSRAKGTNRLALLCIADNAHDDGLAFPGVGELARKMGGVSRRSAGKRIEALAKTPELGVYPRKGSSHDFIIFADMTLTEARTAIRKMMNKRHMTISELRKVRRLFASGKWTTASKSSRVDANPDSQESRIGIRSNHQEPSGNHQESKDSVPSASKKGKIGKKRGPVLEQSPWTQTVVKGSFGIPFEDAAQSPAITGQVHNILRALGKECATLPELIAAYVDHHKARQKSKGKLDRMKSPETVAAKVVEMRHVNDAPAPAPVYSRRGKALAAAGGAS